MKIRLSILSLFFAFTTGTFLTPTVDAAETAAPRDTKQLKIASGSALLMDLQTNKVIYASNPDVVVPIASVSKLMTGLIVLEAKQNMDEYIDINITDTPEMKGVFSRVKIGSQMPRKEMLLIALMSSENRAAASLAHHYPGGHAAFVAAMNAKAKALYEKTCAGCHETGVGGAPKLGDATNWGPRIKTGINTAIAASYGLSYAAEVEPGHEFEAARSYGLRADPTCSRQGAMGQLTSRSKG